MKITIDDARQTIRDATPEGHALIATATHSGTTQVTVGTVVATLDGAAVSIMVDGVWAGSGRWTGSRVEDCAVDLGEDVWEQIDEALAEVTMQNNTDTTTLVTWIVAVDVAAGEGAIFRVVGEPFPAENGWTYQSVIGRRTVIYEGDGPSAEADARRALRAWEAAS